MFDNFINGIKNGFKIANATRKLVFGDKGLFAYPIIAVIISIIAALVVIGAGAAIYILAALSTVSNGWTIVLGIIFLFILYFVVFFIISYFTVAMLLAFREYTKGKSISMGEALNRTAPYAKLIVEWVLFYTVIATIIHIIEAIIRAALSRFGFVGNIISGVITGSANLALAAAVAFALPVIIDEKEGPVDTIKASVSFIVKNFGDTFGGLLFAEIFQIVLTLMGLGLIFIGIIPFFGSAHVSNAVSVFALVMVILGLLAIIIGNILRYVLFNCFKLIVYDYKTRKVLPKGFDAKLIDSSIKRKSKPSNKGPFGLSPVGFGGGVQQQGDI